MAAKNILIVFAHHDHRSLNGVMLDVTVKSLTSQGHKVTVSDLYAMKFNPVMGRDDVIGGPGEGDIYRVGEETGRAYLEGRLCEEIKTEQEKVKEADVVIFQFPLYWMNMPAIHKGYLDRVFTTEFAYVPRKAAFNAGRMAGKKAMLSFTVGAPEVGFTSSGIMGDIELWLWQLQYSVLRFMGFSVMAPNICYGVDTRQKADDLVAAWNTRLDGLLSEKTLNFPSMELFQGPDLTTEAKEQAIGSGKSVSIGQHLGLGLPANTMTKIQQ